MLEERCFRVAGARLRPRTLANASLSTSLRRLRRRSKGAGVTGPREQNTTAQFARRLLPQASAARAAFRTCGPVAAGIGLGVHACGRSGAASSSPSPSPSRERVALAISGRGRGLPGALGEPLSCSPLPLLSSPSERGEVQNDLVRAASLHPLSSGL
eukprot:tig00020909_g15383.t1